MGLALLPRSWWRIALLVPVVFLGPTGIDPAEVQAADDTGTRAAHALYDGIKVETLPNGLRVYLKPIPGLPVVTTKVAYKVGSADEDLDHTGLAHYLEHLMFKGTEKLFPGDIDRLTLRIGGANNAYTTDDYTIYHFDVPAEHWEVPLKIEADRMRNIRIDPQHEFQQEKGAVIAELEQNEDRPWELEQKTILPLLFGKAAPYGHPTIGERHHVRDATAEVIKSYYDRWYHPNNAALVVVGGFDQDVVMKRIKELFGPIPAGKLPERKKEPPVERKAPVETIIPSKFDLPRMIMGFNTIRTSDPDFYALEVLQAVLSGGKTSRLYRKLVEEDELATEVSADNSTGRYPGWFGLYLEVIRGKDPKKAEAALLAELKKVADQPITAAELARVKRQILAAAVFSREGANSQADDIARGVTTNDLDFLKGYLVKIQAVTAADVQKAAKKYLDLDKRVTVWSYPGKGPWKFPPKKADAGPGPGTKVVFRHAPGSTLGGFALARGPLNQAFQKEPASAPAAFSLKDAQRVVLPNGLILLLFENKRLPVFVASAHVRDVRLYEPDDKVGVSALMGRVLDEGTGKRAGPEIAELIENVGGSLSLSSGGGSIKVLAGDRKLGLELLFDSLMDPSFPKEAVDRHREQVLSEIADAQTQPNERALQTFREVIYGKHPFGHNPLGKPEVVAKLSSADLKAFHRQVFVPNNTIVAVVGDFDSKEVIAEITQLTSGWKKAPLPKVNATGLPKFDQFTERIVTMPEASQLHFYMGHGGILRNHPDFYKLLVMDYVLGTGPGFTDRLSAKIRDRAGLAYTVNANITSGAGDQVGLFTCYVGTEPKNFATVKKMFLEELNKIRDEKPTKEEVEDAKKYLLGNLAFQLTTNDRIAGQLLAVERFGLGLGYVDDYRKAVAAVTPDDIQEVAKKHIDPKRLILVAAGALDAKGLPLEKAPTPKDKK